MASVKDVARAIDRAASKSNPLQKSQTPPVGTAVGTSKSGGTLVVGPAGTIVESPATPRGGGGSSPSRPTADTSKDFTPTPESFTSASTMSVDPISQRAQNINSRQEQNVRQGRPANFGLTDSDTTFLRGQNSRALRAEASRQGIDISTPARERSFISRANTGDFERSSSSFSPSLDNSRRGSGAIISAQNKSFQNMRIPLNQKISRILSKVSNALPKNPEGVRGALGSLAARRTVNAPFVDNARYTTDATLAPSVGQRGTTIFTQREKTTFEKFGLSTNDPDAQALVNKINDVQARYNQGSLNETDANTQLTQAKDSFTSSQLVKKGIPVAIGSGVALSLIQGTPVAPVVDTVLLADAFLKRDEIKQQFKDFPIESALVTGAFITGGAIGTRVGRAAGLKGGQIKLDKDNIDFESTVKLSGKEKVQLEKTAAEIYPEVFAETKGGKITDTIAYELNLKDGRAFKVIEFSKLLENGKIDKQIIGFEKAAPGTVGESFAGRGVGSVQKGGGAETFSQVIKFTPARTKLGRLYQRMFPSGKVIDIVERSKNLGTRQLNNRTSASSLQSEAGITAVRNAGRRLSIEATRLLNDLRTKKTFADSPSRIRNIINLERRVNGERPFTEAEFRSLNKKALTETELINIINKIKVKVQTKDLPAFQKIQGLRRETVLGRAQTVTKDVIQKAQLKKTPLNKTFREFKTVKESPLVARGKELATRKPFQKLEQVSKKEIGQKAFPKSDVAFSPSVGTATAAAAFRQRGSPAFFEDMVYVPSKTAFNLNLKTTLKSLGNTITITRTKIQVLNKLLVRLRQKEKFDTFTTNQIKNLEAQRTNLNQREALLQAQVQQVQQRQPQRFKQVFRTATPSLTTPTPRPRERTGGARLVPFSDSQIQKKAKPLTSSNRQAGYDSFARTPKSKAFVKLNTSPLTRKQALSLSAQVIDNSIAATGKIVKINGFAQKSRLNFNKNYFERNRQKFRGQIIRKRESPLTSTLYERNKYRLDKKNETQTIQSYRAKLFKPSSAVKFKSRLKINSKPFKPTGSLKSTPLIAFKKRL